MYRSRVMVMFSCAERQVSVASSIGSTIEASSSSGLLTRVEIGHMRISPERDVFGARGLVVTIAGPAPIPRIPTPSCRGLRAEEVNLRSRSP
jgi:hypothetical protein